MRILIAPDKFKGSLSALEAAEAIRDGFREASADFTFDLAPIADGGEGTVESFLAAMPGGELIEAKAHDPLGRSITANYAWFPDQQLAIIGLSDASGHLRLSAAERDPLAASSVGTGELMADALRRGARQLQIGLGGSAINDGGLGLASALGWHFLDATGAVVPVSPSHFLRIRTIVPPVHSLEAHVTALCDVDNPLLGPRGASTVFGPQKGATPAMVEQLEEALRHIADLCADQLGRDHQDAPGAGAAGGSAFGLMTFCGAGTESGFQAVARLLKLEERMALADLVVTGEGRIDSQSLGGKGPCAIARMARQAGKRCIAFAGSAEQDLDEFDACISILTGSVTLAEAMSNAAGLLRTAAASAARSSDFVDSPPRPGINKTSGGEPKRLR